MQFNAVLERINKAVSQKRNNFYVKRRAEVLGAAAGLLSKQNPANGAIHEDAGCATKVDLLLGFGLDDPARRCRWLAAIETKSLSVTDNRIHAQGSFLAQTLLGWIALDAELGIALSANAFKVYWKTFPENQLEDAVEMFRFPADGRFLLYRDNHQSRREFALIMIELARLSLTELEEEEEDEENKSPLSKQVKLNEDGNESKTPNTDKKVQRKQQEQGPSSSTSFFVNPEGTTDKVFMKSISLESHYSKQELDDMWVLYGADEDEYKGM
jgi:hypothetical protein